MRPPGWRSISDNLPMRLRHPRKAEGRRRNPVHGFLPCALCLVLGAVLAAQVAAPPSTLIDSAALLRDLQVLSADDMQGRLVDTPGSEKARSYLVERFKAAGIQPFGSSYEARFTFAGRGNAA